MCGVVLRELHNVSGWELCDLRIWLSLWRVRPVCLGWAVHMCLKCVNESPATWFTLMRCVAGSAMMSGRLKWNCSLSHFILVLAQGRLDLVGLWPILWMCSCHYINCECAYTHVFDFVSEFGGKRVA